MKRPALCAAALVIALWSTASALQFGDGFGVCCKDNKYYWGSPGSVHRVTKDSSQMDYFFPDNSFMELWEFLNTPKRKLKKANILLARGIAVEATLDEEHTTASRGDASSNVQSRLKSRSTRSPKSLDRRSSSDPPYTITLIILPQYLRITLDGYDVECDMAHRMHPDREDAPLQNICVDRDLERSGDRHSISIIDLVKRKYSFVGQNKGGHWFELESLSKSLSFTTVGTDIAIMPLSQQYDLPCKPENLDLDILAEVAQNVL